MVAGLAQVSGPVSLVSDVKLVNLSGWGRLFPFCPSPVFGPADVDPGFPFS